MLAGGFGFSRAGRHISCCCRRLSRFHRPPAGQHRKKTPRNKEEKWNEIFGSDRYLKCKSKKDIKNVKIFKICKWDHCIHKNENVYDDGLFIGRVQVNINNGKKRKFLYFTADYQLRK